MCKKLIIFLIFFLILFCKSSIVKKQEIENWNKNLEKEYVTINDLYLYEYDFKNNKFIPINETIIVKKNTIVSLQIEASDDWLRVRIFNLQKNLKDYLGEVVFYLTVPEGMEFTSSDLKKIIDEFIFQNFKIKN
jgi:type II secretion system-associated lipoprotein